MKRKKNPLPEAILFFNWMQKGKNWRYYRMPFYRSIENWYKKFKKEMENK